MPFRAASVALAVAGVLFLLYPAVRPWHDESIVDGSVAAMTSPAWVAAHLFAMLGFVLVALALTALPRLPAPSTPLAGTAVIAIGAGAGLTLPYYGAEDFGLHAIAQKFAQGQRFDLLNTIESVRYNPVALTTFAAGLLLLGIGGVLVAVAIWRSTTLPRHSGIALAAGLALFLPQFFTPAPIRIAHGALMMAGAIWLAATLWSAQPAQVGA